MDRLLKVPFNNVSQTARIYKRQILRQIASIIDRGIYLNGEENNKLKKKLSSYLNIPFITLTGSGHDSLSIALSSLNLDARDEVIFPVNSYPTAFPIYLSKGKPIPVDVDINGQIDLESVLRHLTKNTRVIVIVHLYGLVGNVEKILKLARENNITVVEDCAQAMGTKYKKKLVGTLGDIGCFSFYPTKTINTLGDGGFIATKKSKRSDYFEKAVSYGEKTRYLSQFIAGHSRLPEIQAGVLNIFLEHVGKVFLKREKVANWYRKEIKKYGLDKKLQILESHKNSEAVKHLFVIKAENRNQLKKYLYNKGIETLIHYPNPIHLLPAFSYLNYKKGDFKMAEKLSQEILSLPFHPYLSKANIDYVLDNIKSFYG